MLTLILGGARSGKSRLAQQLADEVILSVAGLPLYLKPAARENVP